MFYQPYFGLALGFTSPWHLIESKSPVSQCVLEAGDRPQKKLVEREVVGGIVSCIPSMKFTGE